MVEFYIMKRKTKLLRVALREQDWMMLEEQAHSFGMKLPEMISFLCVNSVCRYRVSREKEENQNFKGEV